MKIKNRQDVLVVVTIAVVALAVAVNFILPPIIDWWSARQKQIADLRGKIKDGTQMIHRETYMRSRWHDMQANALSPDMSQAEQQFLKAMDGWSRDSGTEITSIMPQWKNDGTNYITLNCRVETAGDLNSLTRFIYAVENGPMMVRVDSVELSSHDTTGQQLTLGVEINGLALLQTDKK